MRRDYEYDKFWGLVTLACLGLMWCYAIYHEAVLYGLI